MKKVIGIFKEMFQTIKNDIIWLKDKELIEEQIKIDTHRIDLQNIEINKLKKQLEEIKQFKKEKEEYEKKIKELKKQIRQLKRKKD